MPEHKIRWGEEDNAKIIFLTGIFQRKYILSEMVLMRGHKICFNRKIWETIPKLSLLTPLSRALSCYLTKQNRLILNSLKL